MIVDRAIYRDGRRTAEPLEPGHTDHTVRAGGGLAWIGLYRPTEEEFAAVAAEFGLRELAIEDAVHPHQRPKLERRYRESTNLIRHRSAFQCPNRRQKTANYDDPPYAIRLRRMAHLQGFRRC
jgi:Mg2+ and Co2+ transporter CorA